MALKNGDTLYIRVGKDSIIFAHYDRIKDSTLNYSVYRNNKNISLNANMCLAIKNVALTKGDFHAVHVSVEGKVSLVPLNEFDDDDAEEMFNYNVPEKGRRTVMFDTLPRLNAVMLFAVGKDLAYTITEEFPNASFHSTQMPLVLHFSYCSQAVSEAGHLFACIEQGMLTVAAFRKGTIDLLNSYEVSSQEDMMFFLLAVAKLWNAKAAVDEVYLSGERKVCEEMAPKVRAYLPNVALLKPEEEFNRHVLALTKDLPYDMIILLFHAF